MNTLSTQSNFSELSLTSGRLFVSKETDYLKKIFFCNWRPTTEWKWKLPNSTHQNKMQYTSNIVSQLLMFTSEDKNIILTYNISAAQAR